VRTICEPAGTNPTGNDFLATALKSLTTMGQDRPPGFPLPNGR
jgi:hypothetical protein